MNFIWRALLLIIFISGMPALALAHGLETDATVGTFIQAGHSGNWHAPGQSGHGIFAEVLDDNQASSGKRLLIAWFAYFEGRQVWILASGEIIRKDGQELAQMTAWIYQGNDFPPDYDPSKTTEIPWGEITMYFTGCSHAVLNWVSVDAGYGSGELDLHRLTRIHGSHCDPALGGDMKTDDHGNKLETATWFATEPVYNDPIQGKIEKRADVDVFVFNIVQGQKVVIFTIGSTQTQGVLYRVNGLKETEIATSEGVGAPSNLFIEETLANGSYSVHVTGAPILGTGEYTLWLQTQP